MLSNFNRLLVLLAIYFTLSSAAVSQAKVLGTFGATYPFAERDALSEIEDRAKQVNWAQIMKQYKRSADHYKPPGMKHVARSTKSRTRIVDMTYTLDVDIPDPKNIGHILYPKGYSFNPLEYMALPGAIVFIDASDRNQFEWLKSSKFATDLKSVILLTGGEAVSVKRALRRPVFYADDALLDRFGVEVVPSVARQQGGELNVEEISCESR